MALPTLFAAQTLSTGAQLDANFSALGAITVIPCTIAGSDVLLLTPLANTPTVNSYAAGMLFGGVLTGTNTVAATAAVGGLPALGVWVDSVSGPVHTNAGDMTATNYALFAYDPALGGGSGGFHLLNPSLISASPLAQQTGIIVNAPATLGAVAMTGGNRRTAIISRGGAPGAPFSDTTDTATAIVASMPGSGLDSVFSMRISNTTGQTQTLSGGSGVTIIGTATTATGTTHLFQGVVTNAVTPLVTIYG